MPALAPRPSHPRRDSFRIPKRRRHVPEARAEVRRILKDWAVGGELADDIATVATELVANAVRHCHVPLAEIEVPSRSGAAACSSRWRTRTVGGSRRPVRNTARRATAGSGS
jgi:hypothetical protein